MLNTTPFPSVSITKYATRRLLHARHTRQGNNHNFVMTNKQSIQLITIVQWAQNWHILSKEWNFESNNLFKNYMKVNIHQIDLDKELGFFSWVYW